MSRPAENHPAARFHWSAYGLPPKALPIGRPGGQRRARAQLAQAAAQGTELLQGAAQAPSQSWNPGLMAQLAGARLSGAGLDQLHGIALRALLARVPGASPFLDDSAFNLSVAPPKLSEPELQAAGASLAAAAWLSVRFSAAEAENAPASIPGRARLIGQCPECGSSFALMRTPSAQIMVESVGLLRIEPSSAQDWLRALEGVNIAEFGDAWVIRSRKNHEAQNLGLDHLLRPVRCTRLACTAQAPTAANQAPANQTPKPLLGPWGQHQRGRPLVSWMVPA